MRTKSNRYRFAIICLLLFTVMSVGAVTVFRVHRTKQRRRSPTSTSASKSISVAPATPLPAPIPFPSLQMERITVTPIGLESVQITRGTGPFLLAVDNRSGLDDLNLRLNGQLGAIRTQRASRSKSNWREIMTLPPGTYTMTEAGHR